MNKTTKKFVVTLLSVMMVLSFMPAMSFAAEAPATGSHESTYYYDDELGTVAMPVEWDRMTNDELNTVPVDMQGMTVLVQPTCIERGVGVIKCDIDLNGTACGAERNVWIAAKGHKAGRRIRVTAEELMDSLQMTDAEKAAVRAEKDYCECYVYQCANGCGKYVDKYGDPITKDDLDDFDDKDITEHTAPAGTTQCASSFECTKCKVKNVTNSKFNQTTADEFHWARDPQDPEKWANATESTQEVHVKEWKEEHRISQMSQRRGEFGYKACVRSTKIVCDYCDEVLWSDQDIYGYYDADGDLIDHRAEITSRPAGASETYSPNADEHPTIDHGSKTTKVILPGDEATCEKNSHWTEVCDECLMKTGREGDNSDIKKHDYSLVINPWEGYVPDPGRIEGVVYEATVCKYCGKLKTGSVAPVGFVPDYSTNTTYEKFTDANCEQGTWLKATVKYNATGSFVREYYISDWEIEQMMELGLVVKIDGKYYTTYDQKEIPYVGALGHEFGDIEPIADATCTNKALEGKICKKCHKVDHATVKEVGEALGHQITTITVDPTCGAYGFTYDTCSRCKLVVLPEGILEKDWTLMYVEAAKDIVPVYNVQKPIVSEGTPCTFEWEIIEPATAEKEGKKVLKCTKCGCVDEASYTVIPIDPQAADAAADEAIKAASAVTSKEAKYTPASVQAIKDAIKDLNTARILGDATAISKATKALNDAVAAAVPKTANTMTVKAKTVKAKAKKNTTFKKAKAFTVKKAKGKVTFKKVTGNKKISVTSAGKVAVKKGLKKGKTYKVKVLVTAAGNDNYLAKSKTVTLKVKVK